MKNFRLIGLACILFVYGTLGIKAQNNIVSSGGEATGTGGSVSYSAGQIFYTTNTGLNGSVAQGVQQPYEISVITAIEDAGDINLVCTAYPNPASDFLTLKVDASTTLGNQSMVYHLFDMNGKLLEGKNITVTETYISIGNLASATYFLKVIQGNKEVKTFKIIKN